MSTLKVAAVQYNIDWLEQQSNFNFLEEMFEEFSIRESSVDLLLLPETFSTGSFLI